MIGNFPNCRAFLKRPRIEGGKDDDPLDPGGRTNEGIEQREYTAWLHLHDQPDADVFRAPEVTLTEIYRVQYWNPFADHMPFGVDLVFFDTSVVQGGGYAISCLQRALQVEDDGHFGVITGSALKRLDSAGALSVVQHMTAQRRMRFRSTRGFRRFGDGWLYRADDCQKVATLMTKCRNVNDATACVAVA